MTEEQLDAAARNLCEIRGWRPDSMDHLRERFANPLDTALDYCKHEINTFYQVAKAVDAALSGKTFP